jgi:hypothetical protein
MYFFVSIAQKQLADHHDALLDIMPRLRTLCDELEQTVSDILHSQAMRERYHKEAL